MHLIPTILCAGIAGDVWVGWGSDREVFAAEFAQRHPRLDMWVSSGPAPEKVAGVFEAAGVPLARLHLDYRAVDAMTDFTTMVEV